MKRLYILLMILMSCYAQAQNITQLEYFVDTEPGFGLATSVPVTSEPELDNFKFNVPLAGVSSGFHTLYVRVKNAAGRWSHTYSHPFVTLALRANISRVEFFIDTDPGVGNGTAVTFTAGDALTDLRFPVPLSTVSIGFHTLYVRIRDGNGKWSIVQGSPFMKVPAPPNVTQVEYYVDTDPGVGKGVSVPITAAPVLTALNFSVDVSALTSGDHKLYVRVKNVNDKWSISYSSTFSVCNSLAPMAGPATFISGSGFNANWSAAAGATGYQLDVTTDDFVTSVAGYQAKAVTGTSASVTGLNSNTAYKYRVRAVGTCTSVNSNIISVTTNSCTAPAKPVISILGEFTEVPTLSSSSSTGNQWYLNGSAIEGATSPTIAVEEPGVYKVQVTSGACISDFSEEVSMIVTALESRPLHGISVYPNPVDEELTLYGVQSMPESKLIDSKGLTNDVSFISTGDKVHRANVQHLLPGMYMLFVREGQTLGYIRFIKR